MKKIILIIILAVSVSLIITSFNTKSEIESSSNFTSDFKEGTYKGHMYIYYYSSAPVILHAAHCPATHN